MNMESGRGIYRPAVTDENRYFLMKPFMIMHSVMISRASRKYSAMPKEKAGRISDTYR